MKNKRYRLGAISLGMVLAFGSIQSVQAEIVADSSAAAGLRPDVTETSQGTALVNIQAPSAAGVSRNLYSEFNVDERGVILNNSRGDTTTDWMGESVAGNSALAKGEASIILNEVNSRNPSQLNGMIEVAGQRAEVVIANPSGISCSGCGFINASRSVLTTGQAQIENGALTGYQVEDGAVTVEGRGLYGPSEYTDIIARSVKINAEVQATALNITTGRNRVDAKNASVTKLADSSDAKPELALDVTSLGSVYADKIRMIGTEKGVGVNHAGKMDIFDSVKITADGDIVNSGVIEAGNNIQLTGQNISNSDMIWARHIGGSININSDTFSNTGEGMLYSEQGDVTINSGGVDITEDDVVEEEPAVDEGSVVVPVPGDDGMHGVTDKGLPLFDLGSYTLKFLDWRDRSGFNGALKNLLIETNLQRNDDLLTYLYILHSKGIDVTEEYLAALTGDVFNPYGSAPESEFKKNMEQIRQLSDLVGNCVAGNC